jgi:hypothetical protein
MPLAAGVSDGDYGVGRRHTKNQNAKCKEQNEGVAARRILRGAAAPQFYTLIFDLCIGL